MLYNYELIILVDNLDESLFKGSNKEINISKTTVEKTIYIMISKNIFPCGSCDISNFLKISQNLLSIMNIMNYKISEEEFKIIFYFILVLAFLMNYI